MAGFLAENIDESDAQMKQIPWVEQRVEIIASVNTHKPEVTTHAMNKKFTLKEAMRYLPVRHNWLVAKLPESETIAVIDLLSAIVRNPGGTMLRMKPAYVTAFDTVDEALMWVVTDKSV